MRDLFKAPRQKITKENYNNYNNFCQKKSAPKNVKKPRKFLSIL